MDLDFSSSITVKPLDSAYQTAFRQVLNTPQIVVADDKGWLTCIYLPQNMKQHQNNNIKYRNLVKSPRWLFSLKTELAHNL